MSALADLYLRAYSALCGKHPHVRPWHAQWLSTKDLYRDLREALVTVEGTVVDVGCGSQPYARWMPRASCVIGLDVFDGPRVDHVIKPFTDWPLADACADAVLCTQTLEHVVDLDHVLSQIRRILRPGGTLIVTVPFAYNQHAKPDDYRRFSMDGVRNLLDRDYAIDDLRAQGGVGSTVGVLVLNWLDIATSRSLSLRLAKGIGLPLWIGTSAAVNLAGAVLDLIDGTEAFYGNVLAVCRRRHDGAAQASGVEPEQ